MGRAAGNGKNGGLLERSSGEEASEKIFSAVFESVGEGILLIDKDLEIVKANRRACEIYGVMVQNLIGAKVSSLTDEPGAHILTEFFSTLIEGRRRSAEVTGVYVDGKTFPATLTVTRSDMGGEKYWQIIVQDDTDRKNMERQLREEKQIIEEMNLTLKNVLTASSRDKKEFENRVASKIRTTLLPSIAKISKTTSDGTRKVYLSLLEQSFYPLRKGSKRSWMAACLKLSKTEIEICRLIQAGNSSKELCEALKRAFDTVQTHRRNIRKKLDLNGRKLNLHAYLLNRML
jgi:PAS domain S-box-containing protein